MKRFSMVAVVFCFSLFIAGFVQAACLQSQMAGNWFFHAWSEKIEDPLQTGEWLYGIMTVTATGAVGASTVTDSDGLKGQITGGQLKLSPSCEITGYINILEDGVAKKQTFNHGALSRDHNTANIVGRNPKGKLFKIDCIRK